MSLGVQSNTQHSQTEKLNIISWISDSSVDLFVRANRKSQLMPGTKIHNRRESGVQDQLLSPVDTKVLILK